MNQTQYGAVSAGRSCANRTFYFANVEQRRLDQTGLMTISPERRRVINARLAAVGYQRPADRDRHLSEPGGHHELLGKLDHQVSGRDQFSVRYSLYDVDSQNARGAGGSERAERVGGPGQHRSDDRGQQHADAVAANGDRDARAVRPRRSASAADRSDRAGREHRRRRLVRHELSGSPTRRVNKMYQVVEQPVASGRCARAPGRRRFPLQRRPHYLSARRCAAATRSRRWRISWPASTTTPASRRRSAPPSFRRRTRTSASTLQDEWKVDSAGDAELGLRYDLQFLETIDTDTNNVSPRLGVAWSPFDSRAPSSAAAPGCSSTAFRFARSPTRCCRPATPPT